MNSEVGVVHDEVQAGGDTGCEDAQSGTECVTSVQAGDDAGNGDSVTSKGAAVHHASGVGAVQRKSKLEVIQAVEMPIVVQTV